SPPYKPFGRVALNSVLTGISCGICDKPFPAIMGTGENYHPHGPGLVTPQSDNRQIFIRFPQVSNDPLRDAIACARKTEISTEKFFSCGVFFKVEKRPSKTPRLPCKTPQLHHQKTTF